MYSFNFIDIFFYSYFGTLLSTWSGSFNFMFTTNNYNIVVNIMTDSGKTATPGKSGIRLKREI